MNVVTVLPVTPDRWEDLAGLFERKGPRGGSSIAASCWCMYWRKRTGDAAQNKANLQTIVAAGDVPGLLAYVGDVPVGWVAVAPRHDYGLIMRSPRYRPVEPDEPGVFAITCFFIHRDARGSGVAEALLAAAIEHARTAGAAALEAYPFVEGDDYMGDRNAYAARGFVAVREMGKRLTMRMEFATDS